MDVEGVYTVYSNTFWALAGLPETWITLDELSGAILYFLSVVARLLE